MNCILIINWCVTNGFKKRTNYIQIALENKKFLEIDTTCFFSESFNRISLIDVTNCPIKRNFFARCLFIAAENRENIFNSKRKTSSVKKIVRYEFCLSTSET